MDSADLDSHKEQEGDSVATGSELNNYELEIEEEDIREGPSSAQATDLPHDEGSSSLTPAPDQPNHQDEETDTRGEDATGPISKMKTKRKGYSKLVANDLQRPRSHTKQTHLNQK